MKFVRSLEFKEATTPIFASLFIITSSLLGSIPLSLVLIVIVTIFSISFGHTLINKKPFITLSICLISSIPLLIVEMFISIGNEIMVIGYIVAILLSSIVFILQKEVNIFDYFSNIMASIFSVCVIGWVEIYLSGERVYPTFIALLICLSFISLPSLIRNYMEENWKLTLISFLVPSILSFFLLFFAFSFRATKSIGFSLTVGIISVAKYLIFHNIHTQKSIIGKSLIPLFVSGNLFYMLITLL